VGDFRTLPEKRKEKEIIRSLEPDATKKKAKREGKRQEDGVLPNNAWK